MLLYNGVDVEVIGQIGIDNVGHLIVKLNTPTYAFNSDVLVKYIILHPKEFKEYRDGIKRASDELTNIPKEEPIPEPAPIVEEKEEAKDVSVD